MFYFRYKAILYIKLIELPYFNTVISYGQYLTVRRYNYETNSILRMNFLVARICIIHLATMVLNFVDPRRVPMSLRPRGARKRVYRIRIFISTNTCFRNYRSLNTISGCENRIGRQLRKYICLGKFMCHTHNLIS